MCAEISTGVLCSCGFGISPSSVSSPQPTFPWPVASGGMSLWWGCVPQAVLCPEWLGSGDPVELTCSSWTCPGVAFLPPEVSAATPVVGLRHFRRQLVLRATSRVGWGGAPAQPRLLSFFVF